MQHTILHESETFTVADCRNNKSLSLKDTVVTSNSAFQYNDWVWAASKTGVEHTSQRLSEFKNTYRITVLLHDYSNIPNALRVVVEKAKEQGLVKESPNHINVVLLNNISAADRHIPLTPWMVLHRIEHCLLMPGTRLILDIYSGFADLFRDMGARVDDPKWGWNGDCGLGNFFRLILTSRCARNKEISNDFDFGAELFAQHHMGGVKLLRTKDWEGRFAEANPMFFEKHRKPWHTHDSHGYGWETIHKLFSNPVETDLLLSKLENRVSEDISKLKESLIGKTISF